MPPEQQTSEPESTNPTGGMSGEMGGAIGEHPASDILPVMLSPKHPYRHPPMNHTAKTRRC